jgi:hypothetical protein
MKEEVTGFLLFMLLAISILSLHMPLVASVPDEYEQGCPYHKYVWIEFWTAENGTVFVTVTLGFPSTQYYFEGWGSLTRNGSDFYGDTYIWVGPPYGIYLAVYWEVVNDFNLGQLDEGVYTFTLTSWDVPCKSTAFEVGFPADINDDGKVDIMDIGIVALAYGSHNPDPGYDPAADIYYDGKVDIRDVSFTAIHFGE